MMAVLEMGFPEAGACMSVDSVDTSGCARVVKGMCDVSVVQVPHKRTVLSFC